MQKCLADISQFSNKKEKQTENKTKALGDEIGFVAVRKVHFVTNSFFSLWVISKMSKHAFLGLAFHPVNHSKHLLVVDHIYNSSIGNVCLFFFLFCLFLQPFLLLMCMFYICS
jgi:hypothetical protein